MNTISRSVSRHPGIFARRVLAAILCWVCLCTLAEAQDSSAAATPLRVLFVGSSLTYFNSLPQMVGDLSRQSGEPRKIDPEEVTMPFWGLERHWDAGRALSAIRGGHWDFVVLEGGGRSERFERYVRLFDAEIRTAGARTILYVVWPFKGGSLEDSGEFFDVQLRIADAVGVLSAPVGPAWARAAKAGVPRSSLYNVDGVHPTPTGTYLAACVFLALIYGKPHDEVRFPWAQQPGAADVSALNGAAWAAVQDLRSAPTR